MYERLDHRGPRRGGAPQLTRSPLGRMPPTGPNHDPEFEAFVRHAAERLEANWRANGISMPPGISELFCRIGLEHVRQHPGPPNSFYTFPGSRLLAIVRELEVELPGGRTHPAFAEMFAGKIRAVLGGPAA